MMKIEKPDQSGLADPKLLEKIDRLFACNVGEQVNLPQLVVVGDQSSGKSSVLEGLTKLPFPRDSRLCTRFATQIIFRRSIDESVAASIIPDIRATSEHTEKVRSWSRTDLKALDATSFAKVMTEVHEVMGLSDQQNKTSTSGTTFSNDVLRLEICGKDQEHLSVIDVPGIFKKTTIGLTTKADINLVKTMVQGYMENPRSVMLAVIPANVDIATQEILELASEADPDGHRTLGVLTKPDLVDKGAEERVVDLIAGKTHTMKLGWHLLRNPGQQDLLDRSTDRVSIERAFFRSEAPWNELEKDKVGIQALRTRLQDVLATHIRREFPKVRSEISKKLKLAQHHLLALGDERETPEQQSAYLLNLATRFQKLSQLALDAKYGADDLFDENEDLRLATAVTARNGTFADDVKLCGQVYPFISEEDDLPLGPKPMREVPVPTTSGFLDGNANELEKTNNAEIRKVEDPLDIEEILHTHETLCGPDGNGIITWLTAVYQGSRGFELGTFDSSILATTMKKQSSKWTALGLGYVSDVVAITHNFITKSLRLSCTDENVTNGLLLILMDGLMERYKKALDQVRFLLSIERAGTPITLDHYFNDNLEKCRQKRMQALMDENSFKHCSHGTVVRLDDIMQNHPMSNVEHIVRDIHDILYSYYEVARKRFVDNVCMHAVDHFLVNGPETPLTLFSPSWVYSLSPDQLQSIAGEDAGSKRRRKEIKKEIKSLEAGRRILM